jgi:predicted enzyme related to lactoylglutathione lyase
MSIRNERWPEGAPCWVDLMTTDQRAAVDFYSSLFGWGVRFTGEEFGHYGLAAIGDHFTAGLGEQPPGQSMPAAWTTYLASDDVDKTCDAITGAGGTVIAQPMDVGTSGRMAIAQDPTGAVFGVWQGGDMIGASLVNEPGGVGWNECRTRDPERAMTFYTAVFGYRYTKMEGEEYWTIDGAGPGDTVGGVGELDPTAAPGAPSHWMTYFVVADADATVATARAKGGTVQAGPFDTPFGRMAVISDPQGAVFSIAGTVAEPVAEG